jgi:hypothetical protein
MTKITFEQFAKIIDDAYAVDIDDSLSYPYVSSYADDEGKTVYEYIDIHYGSDYNMIENTFYLDDCEIEILDDGRIKVTANDENYYIKLLKFASAFESIYNY